MKASKMKRVFSLFLSLVMSLTVLMTGAAVTVKAASAPSGYSWVRPDTYYIGASLSPSSCPGDGLIRNEGAVGILDMIAYYEEVSGVDCTSFIPSDWEQMLRGKKTVTDKTKIPNDAALGTFWNAHTITSGSFDTASVTTFSAAFKTFLQDPADLWYTDEETQTDLYLLYVMGINRISNRYVGDSADTTGYCLQMNNDLPGSGLSAYTASDVRSALGITNAQYKALTNILKRGYPRNAGLSDTAFADYPSEALRQGTQLAVWTLLSGSRGNNNDGTHNYEVLLSVDRLKNTTALDVVSYVKYLLNSSSAEPEVTLSTSMTSFTLKSGILTSTVTVTAKNASGGVKLTFTGLPEGSNLNGSSLTGGSYTDTEFNTSAAKTKTYTLSMSAKTGAGRTVSLSAAAWTDYSDEAVDLSYIKSSSTTDQIMTWTTVSTHEIMAAVSASASASAPSPVLKLQKLDAETGTAVSYLKGRTLDGAEFDLYTGEAMTDAAGQTIGKDTKVGHYTTGTDGSLIVNSFNEGDLSGHVLTVGSYYFVETKAPEGYAVNTEKQTVTVSPGDSLEASVSVKDDRLSTSFTVLKLDSSLEPLSGVVFDLYYEETHHEMTTGADGKAVWSGIDPETECLLYEKSVPEGYAIDSDYAAGVAFVMQEDASENVCTVTNQKLGRIRIIKTDADTGDAVQGGVYEVFTDEELKNTAVDTEGKVLADITTQDDGTVLTGFLTAGTYYVKETGCYASGYATDDEVHTVTVEGGSEALITDLPVTEKKISVGVTKVDADTGEILKGAVLEVLTEEGDSVLNESGDPCVFTSGETENLIRGLDPGRYFLREISAPTGYFLAQGLYFEVKDTDEIQSVELEDIKLMPDYTISKERIEAAGPDGDSDGYGFRRGETVTYLVTIKNTGNLALSMTVDDVFEEEALTYFETPILVSVAGDGVTWNNQPEEGETVTCGEISLKVGAEARLIFSAVITQEAEEKLAPDPEDDRDDPDDGYVNTVTAHDVQAYYEITPEYPGGEPETEVFTFTEEDFEELAPKNDTANTPVAVVTGTVTGEYEPAQPVLPDASKTSSRVTILGGKTDVSEVRKAIILLSVLCCAAVLMIVYKKKERA